MASFELIDWVVALTPVLLMAVLFAWLDVFKLMSPWEMIGCLLLGCVAGLVAWPISGRMLDTLPIGYSFYSRIVAPFIEEALKGCALAVLILSNRIGYKLDAVISGFAIGAGFSVIENIFYLARFPELTTSVWLVRGLGTAVMHGTTTAVLAVAAHGLGQRSLRQQGGRMFNPVWLLPGYLLASLIHLAFNQFPNHPMEDMIVTLIAAPVLLIGVMRFGESETHKWLIEDRETHRRWLEEWQSGAFPSDDSGQRIAALSAQLKPDQAALVRDYCIVKAELVLAAEEELLDRDRKLEEDQATRVRAAFARLEEIKNRIGRIGYAALSRRLPFSRNDEWELSELKELLDRD
ncbi:PrsW family intramembrane metalloprotease [Sphingomonas sp. RB56-2]|uniref:PrsW family intramembrane metalloprotease n=1 Tax=Sphingomonas brevis TaxID=2908206 RepID=A0ABT0SC80_9SPHN|nr:PrsW family intramembrane metalloprotease [Sphingomonas brevis]